MTLPGGSGEETAHKNNHKENNIPKKKKHKKLLQLLVYISGPLTTTYKNSLLTLTSIVAFRNKKPQIRCTSLLHQRCGC